MYWVSLNKSEWVWVKSNLHGPPTFMCFYIHVFRLSMHSPTKLLNALGYT